MSRPSRVPLTDLRAAILDALEGDQQWETPTSLCDQLSLGHGHTWYRVALVLERLANDGEIEMAGRGTRVRRFRAHESESLHRDLDHEPT